MSQMIQVVFKLEGSELVQSKHNIDVLLISGVYFVGLYFHKTLKDTDTLCMENIGSFDIFKFSMW